MEQNGVVRDPLVIWYLTTVEEEARLLDTRLLMDLQQLHSIPPLLHHISIPLL